MRYISSIERIGRQEGRIEGRIEIISAILASHFGELDEDIKSIVKPLAELSTAEFTNVLLPLSTLSREELLARFGQQTAH
jgi:hypothetical protein